MDEKSINLLRKIFRRSNGSKPDLKPRKEWKLFKAQTWDAAWNVAWAAAGVAEWNTAGIAAGAATGNALWDAGRVAAGNAAENAAWDAAWAAGNVAGNAAGISAGNAAGNAALLARIKVCKGLKLDQKHIDHSYARWEVWQKGYALMCDIKDILYVYAAEASIMTHSQQTAGNM